MMILVPHFGRQEATPVSSVGPELISTKISARQENTKVTIIMGQTLSSAP
jgi:hypothetical protein